MRCNCSKCRYDEFMRVMDFLCESHVRLERGLTRDGHEHELVAHGGHNQEILADAYAAKGGVHRYGSGPPTTIILDDCKGRS